MVLWSHVWSLNDSKTRSSVRFLSGSFYLCAYTQIVLNNSEVPCPARPPFLLGLLDWSGVSWTALVKFYQIPITFQSPLSQTFCFSFLTRRMTCFAQINELEACEMTNKLRITYAKFGALFRTERKHSTSTRSESMNIMNGVVCRFRFLSVRPRKTLKPRHLRAAWSLERLLYEC